VSDVTVQFLGTGDAFGSGGRFQTCILVRSQTGAFLIDCGASSLIAMKRFGVDPAEVRAILLTHLHGDHFGGIPYFVLDAQFAHRTQPLIIAGPPGLKNRIRDAMEVLFPGSAQVQQRFAITYAELPLGASTDRGIASVVPYEVRHESGAPAHALRVTSAGKVVAYSGDTEWTDSLLEAGSDADLFICEAYFFEKKVRYHLNYLTLAEHRSQLRCRRLVLTHMSADMLQHLAEIGAEHAEDGNELVI
jgi:ribonuclease BN (tRNA processing enzyme)